MTAEGAGAPPGAGGGADPLVLLSVANGAFGVGTAFGESSDTPTNALALDDIAIDVGGGPAVETAAGDDEEPGDRGGEETRIEMAPVLASRSKRTTPGNAPNRSGEEGDEDGSGSRDDGRGGSRDDDRGTGGDQFVVRGVNLTVRAGDLVAVVGAVGSGKSVR